MIYDTSIGKDTATRLEELVFHQQHCVFSVIDDMLVGRDNYVILWFMLDISNLIKPTS